MIKIQNRRKAMDDKGTAFRLRKRPVPPEKIVRFAKRRKLSKTKDEDLGKIRLIVTYQQNRVS